MPIYEGPAAITRGFQAGQNIANDIQQAGAAGQQQALNVEIAKKATAEYADSMKPINLQDIGKVIPSHLQAPMLALTNGLGLVEKQGDMLFIRKGKMQQFMKEFSVNKVYQASVLEGSQKVLDLQMKGVDQQIAPIKQKLQKDLSYFDEQINKLQSDVLPGSAVNPLAVQKIEGQKGKYIAQNKGLIKQVQDLEQQKFKMASAYKEVIVQTGMINKSFEDDSKKFGWEDAVRISTGEVSRDNIEAKHAYIAAHTKNEEIRETERVKGQERTDRMREQEAEKTKRAVTVETIKNAGKVRPNPPSSTLSNQAAVNPKDGKMYWLYKDGTMSDQLAASVNTKKSGWNPSIPGIGGANAPVAPAVVPGKIDLNKYRSKK